MHKALGLTSTATPEDTERGSKRERNVTGLLFLNVRKLLE
jgi:hypothetical protein